MSEAAIIAETQGEGDDPASRPQVALLPSAHRRGETGHPWIYSNEIVMDPAAKALAPGTLVTLRRADGRPFGVAMFNPHTLIAARVLDRDAARVIDRRFFTRRLERALKLRERLYDAPYYRLVHAEADGLPGSSSTGSARSWSSRPTPPGWTACCRSSSTRCAASSRPRRSCCATTARRGPRKA